MQAEQRRRRLSTVLAVAAGVGLLAQLGPGRAEARRGAAPISTSQEVAPLATVDVLEVPAIDREALLAEDRVNEKGPASPLRFATTYEVDVSPATHGTWELLADGGRLWRLRVYAPAATDLNLGLVRYLVPAGTVLHVRAENHDYYEGPYTEADNKPHGQLWVPVVPGERAVLEMYLPREVKNDPDIRLAVVGRGYRDLFGDLTAPEKSGACNNDVICPVGDPWRDQIRAVGVYTLSGSWTCSGTMVNNVRQDCLPYLLTANHCGINAGNAPSLTVYWNFEASVCTSPRTTDGSLSDNQTGSTLRAAHAGPDFALVELDEAPDPSFGVYWAGWDRSGSTPLGSVGIHHPNTDEKAITFNTDPLTRSSSCIDATTDTHWHISQYEDGTTESGSSGSALFDSTSKLVIGTLSGGLASCSSPSEYDCYGRLEVAWNPPGSTLPSQRARDWLDPSASGGTSLAGRECAAAVSIRYNAHLGIDTCAVNPSNNNGIWEPVEEIELAIELRSFGDLTGVVGVLSVLTPGVTIIDGDASWGAMFNGTPKQSAAPHFRVQLGSGVACFAKVDFTVRVTANEGGPWVLAFSNPVGRVPTGLPGAIPDGLAPATTLASPLVAPDAFTLTDVNVRVNISHSYVGDLSVSLRHPGGTTVQLLNRPGEPASPFGCNNDDMVITFDDASGFDPEGHCAGATPWYSGVARPVEALSAFNGLNVNGTWQLIVGDHVADDFGDVVAWDLLTTPPLAPPVCNPCSSTGCAGVVIAQNTLFLTKLGSGEVKLWLPPKSTPCALGVQVRMASTPFPTVDPGSFPSDPAFANITGEDTDGGQNFVHTPPVGNAVYLAVEDLPGGAPGPSGRYRY